MKNKTLDKIFKKMPTYCRPWSASEEMAKNLGIKYPECNSPVVFQWSMKGKGFGEFSFKIKKGKVHCDNEMEPKWFIKMLLCKMVDDATFGPTWKKG